MHDYGADRVSLADVLGRQEHYVVPNYQRPYTWDTKKAEELWDDLMHYYTDDITKKNDGYLLGPIVTLSEPTSNEHSIVDGQQRLVTLTLLFCAIRDSVHKHTEQRSESDREILKTLIQEIDTLIVDKNNKGLISLNDGNGTSTFSEIQESRHSSNVLKQRRRTSNHSSVKRLIKNYELLMRDTDELCSKCNLDRKGVALIHAVQTLRDIINDVKNRNFFVRIDIFNPDYSYQVFKSLNSKGEPLRQADLIKSYLMEILDKSDAPSSKWQEADWEEIIKKGGEKPDSLLYESLLSRPDTKSHKDPSKKYLYKFVRGEYKTPDEAKAYLKDLKEDAAIIAMLNHPSELPDRLPVELKHSFFGIRQIGARFIRRPIIAACRKWSLTDRDTILLTDCLLKFFFMYRTIGEGNLDTLKKISRQTTRGIVNGDTLSKILPIVLKSDKAGVEDNVDEATFKREFKVEIQDLNEGTAKYILMSLEHQLAKPGGISTTVAGSTLELEHIFPAQPSQEWHDSENLREHRCRLGNLTMMPASWNKRLSNRSFKDKKSGWGKNEVCYEQSALKLNQLHLKDYNSWTLKEIKDREAKLCELAFDVWTLEKYRKMAVSGE